MPDAASLLPANATELERDLSTSMDSLERLPSVGQLIRSSKRQNIPESVVPWLIYEYGLGELLPFLTDPRTAIADGVLWQRLRGTPESFRIALGWIGNTGTIEESEAGTIRWSQFQLGLAQAPADLSQTDSVVELARLSSPVRSSLFRIYGGYDHRRFWLDDTLLSSGSWLADHTGVYLRDDWPQLSFGREYDISLDFFSGRAGALGTETIHTDGGEYEDRMLLSCSQLSELVWRTWHLEDPSATISRLHFTADGPWWQRLTTWSDHEWEAGFDWSGVVNEIAPALQFARAGIYLSDTDDALGDTNACFPAKYAEEVTVGTFVLSEGDLATGEGILSEHKSTYTEFEILERIDRTTYLGLIWLAQYQDQIPIAIAHGVDLTDNLQLSQGNIDHPGVGFGPLGDAAGHVLGLGEDWFPLGTTSFADGDGSHGYAERFDLSTLVIDEAAETISAVDSNGTTHTQSLFGPNGIRRVTEFRNAYTDNTAQIYVGAPVQLLPTHREHQRTLAYDDVFRLDQHLLSEHPFNLNELAVTRTHTRSEPFFSITTGNWGQATWLESADWQQFSGLTRHLTQNRTQLYLSEDTILDGTHAVLGWPTSERYERDHYADATENRQSFTTRQHTRSLIGITWTRFTFRTWDQETWAGDGAWMWLQGAEDDWNDGGWASTAWWDGLETWSSTEMWAKRAAWDPTSLTIESTHETIP